MVLLTTLTLFVGVLGVRSAIADVAGGATTNSAALVVPMA